jgi:tRNA(Arg) A34 adenosine deaminase TadA
VKNHILNRMRDAAYAVALSGQGVGQRYAFRHGAVLFDRSGKIVSAKSNSLKTHPKLARFTDYPYLHAESACIIGHGMDNCDGLSLLVLRVLKNDQVSLSKPCVICQRVIEDAGLKSVYYTDVNGLVKRL